MFVTAGLAGIVLLLILSLICICWCRTKSCIRNRNKRRESRKNDAEVELEVIVPEPIPVPAPAPSVPVDIPQPPRPTPFMEEFIPEYPRRHIFQHEVVFPGNPYTRMNFPEFVFPMEGQYYPQPQLTRRASTRRSRMGLAGPSHGNASGASTRYGTFVKQHRRSGSRQPRYESTDSETEGYDRVQPIPQPRLVRVEAAEVPIHEGKNNTFYNYQCNSNFLLQVNL